MLLKTSHTSIKYPVLVVQVEGIKCRVLIDNEAGSYYASLNLINKKRIQFEKNTSFALCYQKS